MTGFATSVIACGCEAGIDRALEPSETPDGRPGIRVLLFAVSTSTLETQLTNAARPVRADLPRHRLLRRPRRARRAIKLGAAIRYFGDGWQIVEDCSAASASGASP